MGQITVITGASSGIGAALAERCAERGDTVVLMARRMDALQTVEARIHAAGGQAHAIAVDVTQPTMIDEAFKRVTAEIGPVDCLVINAGIGDPTPATKFDADRFRQIIDVNLTGPAYCLQAVLPSMLERGVGQIVGIGSLAGYRGLPGSGAYCASKAGIASLFESLRLELRHHKVDVTLICPGFIRTPLTERNRFPMPFLLELDDASRRIHRAILRKDSEYSFPWQLSWAIRLARFLPNWVYDRVVGKRIAKKSASS